MRFSVLTLLAVCLTALAFAGSATASKPRVSPSDRQAINATLDTFVNHAVKRQDAGAAFDVVTPAMRGGMTRAQWSRGSIPVYPYPAAGQHFHQWTIQYRTSKELAIELLLSPRPSSEGKVGQFLFHVYLQPAHGRWLVDSFMPGATFSPIGKPAVVQAGADFTASPGGSTYNRPSAKGTTGPRQVSAVYAIVPFAIIGLLLLGLAGWGVLAAIRNRRLVGPPEPLPPFPRRASDNR
ncbi:MAG: hypothetical protein AABM30_00245 [Actinomycetota bacterium]